MRFRAVLFAVTLVACGGATSDGGSSSAGASGASGASGGAGELPGAGAAPGASSGGAGASGSSGTTTPPLTGRDWAAYPAIADLAAPAVLYAVSDVHGGYARLATLLLGNAILSRAPTGAGDAHWGASGAILVVTGDLIDKGPSSIEVLDFLIALQADAPKSGGRVVVMLGNHEAEFLANPTNSKASGPDGIDPELTTRGLSPDALATGADPRGAWLRVLPFGARIGGWFFSHAGDSGGRTLAALDGALQAAVKAHADYNDPEIVGTSSILESRAWYTSPATVTQSAASLGVKHIVFGHDPNALGPRGAIAVASGNALLRIDCGMSPGVNDSKGKLLRVTQQGATDVVDELDEAGGKRALFQAAR